MMHSRTVSWRFSRLGAGLCALYLALIVLCLIAGFAASSDPKGRFVFFQLPIAVQGGLLQSLGLGTALEGLSWPLAYILLGGATFLLLYFLGALIERKARG
jgi:hypothetical protein